MNELKFAECATLEKLVNTTSNMRKHAETKLEMNTNRKSANAWKFAKCAKLKKLANTRLNMSKHA